MQCIQCEWRVLYTEIIMSFVNNLDAYVTGDRSKFAAIFLLRLFLFFFDFLSSLAGMTVGIFLQKYLNFLHFYQSVFHHICYQHDKFVNRTNDRYLHKLLLTHVELITHGWLTTLCIFGASLWKWHQ